MPLYHYTTESRHHQILRARNLRPSMDTQHDAAYGEGWYFTDLPPSTCEKILMYYCWQKGTLHRRVDYYFELQVAGGSARQVPYREHVFFVPINPYVSFHINRHGAVPECPLKPCHSCSINPEKS